MSINTDNTVSAALLASVNGTKSTAVDPNSTAAAQDRFLTLLVTQMKNQDPLNPMDNAQVTSQLAQLSTVNGIDKLNTTVQALQSNFKASQSLQAASLIGHGVLVPGSTVSLKNGAGALGVELTSPADSLKVTIRDGGGRTVRSLDLGSQESGTIPISWDGKTDAGADAADGEYTFAVSAVTGGAKVATTALAFGQVSSVSTNAQGVKVNGASFGAIDVAEVRQFF